MRADDLRLVTRFLQFDNSMQSFSVSESISATSTGTTTSQDSQPSTADGQRPRSSFMGLSTAIRTPESALIPATYHQQDELGLLSEMGTTQISPLEAIATHLAVTFDKDRQGRSASSLSLSNEPSRSQRSSQPVDDVAPIVGEEQGSDPTDANKWITVDKSQERPYRCGYPKCGKTYSRRYCLIRHFVQHTGTSKFKCPYPKCVGNEYFGDNEMLKRHIASKHSLDKPFQCDRCNKQFTRKDSLLRHRKHAHSPKKQKKSTKPQSVSKSSSAATATITATASTSTMTSRFSQPELAAGQRQQGSYVGTSTTIDTPESMQIASYNQQDGLKLLAEVSTSQINPFAALATHQTVTFDDEAVTTEIAGVSNLPSDQYQAEQSPDPTDTNKWIIVDKSQERPYRCGYPGGCDKNYLRKGCLVRHFIVHTGVSNFGCAYPECVGKKYFNDQAKLERHIICAHTLEKPFRCDRCKKRFRRIESLKYHMNHVVHVSNNEKKSPKRKKK